MAAHSPHQPHHPRDDQSEEPEPGLHPVEPDLGPQPPSTPDDGDGTAGGPPDIAI